jgi:hypothetical protein
MDEMPQWLLGLLSSVTAIAASSGFWAWLASRNKQETSRDRILMGLAYDVIKSRGTKFIEAGWISQEEYEDFRKLFFDPYKALGGNGLAEKIMAEVQDLPFQPPVYRQVRGKREGQR